MKKILVIVVALTLVSCGSVRFGKIDSNWANTQRGGTNCPSFR